MGARQSKRSVDITTTPKKGEEILVEGEGKLEKIGEVDVKQVTTNGALPHNDLEIGEKEEDATAEKDSKPLPEVVAAAVPEVKENGVADEETAKTPEGVESPVGGDGAAEPQVGDAATEKAAPAVAEEAATTPDPKGKKEKIKKKKWSFRSISFSKKDKSKPNKEGGEKNGDVKEVVDENAEEAVTSPTSAETPKGDDAAKPAAAPVEVAVANGDASTEELAKPTAEEPPKPQEEKVAEPEQPKEEAKKEEAVVKEEVKEQEVPKVPEEEAPKVEEKPVEESKEVRNDDVPPPLPSSNPPSPVTVFAESTKADAAQLPDLAPPPPPQVPQVPEIVPQVVETIGSQVPKPEDAPKTEIPPIETKISTESVEPAKSTEVPKDIEITPLEPPKVDDISEPPKSTETPNEVEVPAKVESSTEPPKPVESVVETPKVESSTEPPQVVDSVVELPKIESTEQVVENIEPPKVEGSTEPPKVIEQETPKPEPITNPVETADAPKPIESTEPIETPLKTEQQLPTPPASPIVNADSLPDISTESLPSLPEPLSENTQAEPMSLPPVDSVPEPIAIDQQAQQQQILPPSPEILNSQQLASEKCPILTNGNTNGLPSPQDEQQPVMEGPLKQVPTETPEVRQEVVGDKPSDVPAEKAAVEE